MKRLHQRFMTFGLGVLMLLTPVLISGDEQPLDAAELSGAVKMLEVSTVGPQMLPYQMTPGEIDKLKHHAAANPSPATVGRPTAPPVPQPLDQSYTGMTPAELDKLARWREANPDTDMPMREGPSEQPATFTSVPRAAGIEGMTPDERAKLEAYLKLRR